MVAFDGMTFTVDKKLVARKQRARGQRKLYTPLHDALRKAAERHSAAWPLKNYLRFRLGQVTAGKAPHVGVAPTDVFQHMGEFIHQESGQLSRMRLQGQARIFDHAVEVQVVLQKVEKVCREFLFARRTKANRQRHARRFGDAIVRVARRQVEQIALLDLPILRGLKVFEDAQRRVVDE